MKRENWNELQKTIKAFASGRSRGKFAARFDTSDVSQETLIQLLSIANKDDVSIDEADSPPEVKKGWLRRAAVGNSSKLRRFHSAKKRDVNTEGVANETARQHQVTPERAAILNEQKIRLAMALQKLSDEERFVIDRYHARGMRIAAIASELDRSHYLTKKLYDSALSKLQSELA